MPMWDVSVAYPPPPPPLLSHISNFRNNHATCYYHEVTGGMIISEISEDSFYLPAHAPCHQGSCCKKTPCRLVETIGRWPYVGSPPLQIRRPSVKALNWVEISREQGVPPPTHFSRGKGRQCVRHWTAGNALWPRQKASKALAAGRLVGLRHCKPSHACRGTANPLGSAFDISEVIASSHPVFRME